MDLLKSVLNWLFGDAETEKGINTHSTSPNTEGEADYNPEPLDRQILSFHEVGGRSYQEDFLLMDEAMGLYIVCDGVGGAAKGEVASRFVAETFLDIVKEDGIEPSNDKAIQSILVKVQKAFQNRVSANPEEEGMATTFTMVYVKGNRAVCAHIGDSRIYHISSREKKSLWQSKDHSLVQELFDSGVLTTIQQMVEHPMRNRITRALQVKGRKKNSFVEADVTVRTITKGDILMLCSDGVLEPFLNEEFIDILCDNNLEITTNFERIKDICIHQSSDNSTCIAIIF